MSAQMELSEARRRRAFTLQELLVALSLILFIMVILTEQFRAGMETFRNLKAIGDLNERLRAAAIVLRRDMQSAHFDTHRFIVVGLRDGAVDAKEAGFLRAEYQSIHDQSVDLEAGLEELERTTTDPVGKRKIHRTLEDLRVLKDSAAQMVWILSLINPPPD